MKPIGLLLVLLCCAPPAQAQVNNPAYADYFLVGRFGEICTMCEAVVLCEGEPETPRTKIPAEGDFTLYHIQTRTFWSQIATIWEWFVANFNSGSLAAGHSRPVDVYQVEGGTWSQPRTVDAQVSLDPATIVLDDHVIDRVERRWLSHEGSRPLGFCQRLPLWESLDTIAMQSAEADR
ncbi:MAG: hypothetical protein HKN81_11090 [Gammaproteobacteria bacterium]|nr:hypothetical protein [Gammaproteobacteria bacterium]